MQYERNGLYASLQQQFYVKNVQKITITGLLRLFLVYIINFYLKKRKIAVIPKQFNVSKVKLFFVCILVWRNYR